MLSEREICKEYGVSRTTVRTALKELETLGYIYKRHGKGTFISSQWKERQNLLEGYSFTEQMRELGRTPSTIITAFHYYKADSYIAQQLGEYFQAKGKTVKIQHKSLERNKKI